MIDAKNISKHFGENGFDSIDIMLSDGVSIGLSGASGCGKSTVLNILSGMLRPDSGTVEVDGVDIYKLNTKKRTALRAKKIGYMMQGSILIPEFTVIKNILLPGELTGRQADRKKADELCERLGIENIKNSYPSEISGGEYRRVMLARVLVAETPILLADEPTSNLDEASAEIVRDMIEEVRRKGVSVIAASHDKKLLDKADQVIEM